LVFGKDIIPEQEGVYLFTKDNKLINLNNAKVRTKKLIAYYSYRDSISGNIRREYVNVV